MKRTRILLGLLPIVCALWLATPHAFAAIPGRGDGSGTSASTVPTATTSAAPFTRAQNSSHVAGHRISIAQTPQGTHVAVHTQSSTRQHNIAQASLDAVAAPAHTNLTGATAQMSTSTTHTGVPLHLPSYSPLVSTPQGALDGGAMLLLAGKFAVVLVLLFVCLRVLRAIMPGMRGDGKRGGAMVLHSEPIGDKQRVCLLDLQDRLVLVGISATGMTALTTIEDVEQVAMLRERYSAKPVATAREEAAPAGPSFAATLAAAALAAARSSHNRTVRPFAPMGKSLNKDLLPASTPRTSRWGTGAARADAQAEHNPSLDRALEAMRAVRQKLASPFDPLGKS